MTERLLARIDDRDAAFPEIEWINSRVRLLGESYAMACRSIEGLIKDGSMIVVESRDVAPG